MHDTREISRALDLTEITKTKQQDRCYRNNREPNKYDA